jgi:sialidase-1
MKTRLANPLHFIMGLFLTTTLTLTTSTYTNAQKAKAATPAAPEYAVQKIFTGGEDGYHSYRIPSLVRSAGHGYLLAICEGRKNSNKDYANIDIVCKRSLDNGVTWGKLQVIADPGNYTMGNPTTVVDQQNGKIFVFMVKNDSTHYNNADNAFKDFVVGERTIYYCSSTDEGATWSAPVNVTATTQPMERTKDWIGPGVGIQKIHGADAGYLIIPAYGRNIYSADHGITWKDAVYDQGTKKSAEATIIEKLNGDLIRNDRPITTLPRYRQVATGSLEGGFNNWASDTNLPDPVSQGSVWRYNDPEPNRILFLNSASQKTRTAMMIRISYDEGNSYPVGRDIPVFGSEPGKLGGYSSLTKTADRHIGALIEYNEDVKNNTTSQRSIVFSKFNLLWILNGAVENPTKADKNAGLVAATTTVVTPPAPAPITSTEALNYIYKPGDNGYMCFRIPSMITTKTGMLLAFAEGRKKDCSDAGDIDLVLRRSVDGGKTWGPLQVVWNDSTNTCGNPVPIQDVTTGKIWLISTWNFGTDHEKDIKAQTSKYGRNVYVLSSADEGKTWSTAKEITNDVKRPGWTWYATGPCHGVQISTGKYKGRLAVPVNHIEFATGKNFVHTIYSDDHGKTWKLGENTPQAGTNEVTMAEIANGNLMMNIRNADRANKTRLVTTSTNGGQTWGDVTTDTTLIEPVCQGSLLSYQLSKNKQVLFFINPANKLTRANVTIRASFDQGKTWPNSQVVFPGPSAYSDIAVYNNKEVACLYEAGITKPYEGIAFKTISLTELTKQ